MSRRVAIACLVLSMLSAACGARFKDDTSVSAGSATANGSGESVTGDTTNGQGATGTETAGGATGGGTAGGATGGATATTRRASASGGGATVSDTGIGSTQGVTATTIKLGYLLPLTGAAPVPSNFDNGAKVYWEYVNQHGGINGRTVTVQIEDTGSNQQQGLDKAKKLIETDKVFAIVVLDRLENQAAIARYLDKQRSFPNISIQTPANIDPSYAWTFGITIDHAVQGTLIADYLVKSEKHTKLAVIYENVDELKPGVEAFKSEAKKLGATINYSNGIDGQANEYSTDAQQLSSSGATAAWLYMAPSPAAKIANQTDTNGRHLTYFANSISWAFDLTFAAGKTAFKGARGFSPWVPVSDPRAATYKAEYERQNPGSTADDIGIVGWGVGEIVGEAIRRTGRDLGQNAFRRTFQTLDFKPDIWAPIHFAPGVREGANVVAVLKADEAAVPDHWVLQHDFSSAF